MCVSVCVSVCVCVCASMCVCVCARGIRWMKGVSGCRLCVYTCVLFKNKCKITLIRSPDNAIKSQPLLVR